MSVRMTTITYKFHLTSFGEPVNVSYRIPVARMDDPSFDPKAPVVALLNPEDILLVGATRHDDDLMDGGE